MAVEKMKMMNLVALKKDTHNILKEIVLNGCIHITNPSNASNFTMRYIDSQISHFESMGIDMGKIKPYESEKIFQKKKYKELFEQMFAFFDIKEEQLLLEDLSDLDYNEKLKALDEISKEAKRISNLVEANEYAIEKISTLINAIEYFSHNDLNVSKFTNLKHIKCDIGKISKNSWLKLKANYENIKALVVHLGTCKDSETIMIFTPKIYQEDTKYFLRSLSFEKIELPNLDISFKEMIDVKKKELEDLEKQYQDIKKEKENFKQMYMQDLLSFYYRYKIIEKIEQLENHMVQSKNFVILSGFIPNSKVDEIRRIVENTASDALIYFNEDTQISSKFKIPTKLKNNFIIKPFEELVNMYSIPNYKEADPTPFFAITYMLLFGMMFGDVGQGLVMAITGYIMSKKIGSLAKIIQRIGISSTIFGFLYGSIFGIEEILPAILIRPMEDINTILISTITLGIIMMIIAYFIGFYNLKSRNEMLDLYFDKNGISGFVFYMAFLILLLNMTVLPNYIDENLSSLIKIIGIFAIIISSSLMFIKPKLEEKFKNKNSSIGSMHKEEFSAFESGFELFETIMGFFSNTLSFIRVGAFAINHVGLFMAFHALGEMTGSKAGNILMIVLGNIIILGLEGLIVSIQAIRLEYYELFSKYFKGEGIGYEPIHVDIKSKM